MQELISYFFKGVLKIPYITTFILYLLLELVTLLIQTDYIYKLNIWI